MVGGEDIVEEHGTQTPQNEEIFASRLMKFEYLLSDYQSDI